MVNMLDLLSVNSPDGDKVVEYGQFFVRVIFALKNSEEKGHRQRSDIRRLYET